MKKMFAFALMTLLAATTFATDDELQIASTNTMGVTCVTSSLTNFPIAVTYGACSNQNVNACITNLICTDTLAVGDTLWVFSSDGGTYDTYELNDEGKWEGTMNAATWTTPDAKDAVLAFGRGVWLFRSGAATREEKRIITYGQVGMGKISVEIKAGGKSKETMTLMSFPFSEPLVLNKAGLANWSSFANKNDRIYYFTDAGEMKSFKWNATQGWRYHDGTTYVTDCQIPRGTAFYYARAKGQAKATLEWDLSKL